RWKESTLPDLAKRLRWAFAAALLGSGVSLVAGGSLLSSFGVLLAVWVAASTLVTVLERTRNARGSITQRFAHLGRV
ncbi:cytochrome c-type biogenesis CcmF C-terminal domain-containing protein, partial [Streptomyces brasiliscabiei]|uniref:cytochrome c-type biogenesis CcmF C-terminal domain-containing protein n=1 Tax=Streptomyces brasiliscabiei TaxID=2736302 RepID=UPI003015843B